MRLDQLAQSLELSLHGNGDHEISGIASIKLAEPDSLSFVVSQRYREALIATQAGVVIVPESLVEDAPGNYMVSSDPYLSYARASTLLYPEADVPETIATNTSINSTAQIGADAVVGDFCVIGPDSIIGAGCVIGAGCTIGPGCRIGANSRLFPNVTIYHGCFIGESCRIQSGAVIGAEGFGYAPGGAPGAASQGGWTRINQVGKVRLGNRVEVGANTTIDRGAIEDTVIGDGVILDNQIQIAHNVQIGENTAIAGCVGVAGSTVIGKNCRIGGKSAIVGHIEITDNVTLLATSFVSRSISQSGVYGSGMPLQESKLWRRTFARLGQLDNIARRLGRLDNNKER